MTTQTTFDFQWFSPLGIAAGLFLSHGIFLIVIGIMCLVYLRRWGGTKRGAAQGGIILSPRHDSAFFGRPIGEIASGDPVLVTIVDFLMDVRGGLWLAFGIFETALVWFGVREGLAWAFWAVVLANLGALAGWASISWRFIRSGVRLGFDLPPIVFLYAAVITPVAAVLGWIGLR